MKRIAHLGVGMMLMLASSGFAAAPSKTARSVVGAPGAVKQASPAISPAGTEKELETLTTRVHQREEAKHSLAPYLKESVAIIERDINAIKEDRSQTGSFYQTEAALEESECVMLLASLKDELDLIDRNEKLAPQAITKTVNARDLGAMGDGVHDDGPALNKAIAKAVALGAGAKVVIPKGRYALGVLPGGAERCHILLNGLSDLTIDAEPGTMFVMKDIAGGIVVRNCRNVLLRGFAIDNDPLPFTQGAIVAVNPKGSSFEMVVDKGFPEPTREYFKSAHELRGTVRFADSHDIDLAGGDPNIEHVEKVGPDRYRLTVLKKGRPSKYGAGTSGFTVGRLFSLHARNAQGDGPGVNILSSQYVTFENVTIYAACGHAYYIGESDGVKLRNCITEPLPGSGRLACNTADGFHCQSNRKGPYLENCCFRGVNDDCVNIFSKCYTLAKALSATELVLDLPDKGERGKTSDMSSYNSGDTVAIVNPNNGAVDAVARVVGVTTTPWKGKPNLTLRLDHPVPGLASRESLGKAPVRGREYVGVTPSGPVEHFIVNLNTKGDGFVIQGCDFGHNRASGLKLKCGNGIFENNKVERPMGGCVRLWLELPWREGWAAHNVVIRNNTFDYSKILDFIYATPFAANPGPRLFRRILIEGNTFLGASTFAVRLNSAQDVRIVNNRIQSSNPVSIENCDHVQVVGNTIEMPKDAAGEAVQIGDRCDKGTIEVKDNRIGRRQ